MTRRIAFFDFDGTLVKGDSLLPYLAYVTGWGRMSLAFAQAVFKPLEGQMDTRTAIKAALLARCLKGVSEVKARAAAENLTPLCHWKQPAYGALLRLKEEGCTIVVATGALELYMPQLLKGLPVDHIIATEMESHEGVLTGAMRGGNCVRQEKARRVAEFLRLNGPYDETYGYGNAPHDLPMLALLDHQVVI